MQRRNFLKTSVAASTAYNLIPDHVLGANDRMRLAVMGCGNMAGGDVKCFANNPQVEITAFCDVKADKMAELQKRTGLKPKHQFEDYRKMLELKDLDALLNATPDHWHAIPTIEACQRNLDVYVEKPLSHNIAEGRAMVQTARQYDRVVQMGTQQRSGVHFQQAVDLVQSGYLGEISMVKCWNNSNKKSLGNPPDSTPPADLNWDLWQGPAPSRPYNKNYYNNFRRFYDYAGGIITDWFTHWVDIVQWAMQVQYPHTVAALADKFYTQHLNNYESPNTIEAVLHYDNFLCTYTHRRLNATGMHGKDKGIMFFGSNATMFLDRNGYTVTPEMQSTNNKQIPKSGETSFTLPPGQGIISRQNHVNNFLECMRTRQRPISDVEEGHYSTVASHLCNIAVRSGETIKYDGEKERVTNHPEANIFISRDHRTPYVLPG
jgi:predicted dehydrogenase